MTSSDFLTDPFTLVSYPWEHEILKDWLVQYFRFLKISPEVIASMKERADEFELVPVPKSLSQRIMDMPMEMKMMGRSASSFMDDPFSKLSPQHDTLPTDALRNKIAVTEKLRSYPIIADLMRSFVNALEEGDVEAALKVISDDYADESGRNKDSLKEALIQLMNLSSSRRVMLVHAEKFDYVDGMIVAQTTGAWEARFSQDEAKSSEFFALELIFAQDKNGNWKIRSIKHE